MGEATVRLLRQLGYHVDFPEAQTCCGQPAFNAGFRSEAQVVAKRNLSIFADYEYIVVPSGSCAAMFRHFYSELFVDDPVLRDQARELATRTYELSEFLVNVVRVDHLDAVYHGKVAYHASCHLLRELGVTAAPLQLIRLVEGIEVVSMDLEEQCCGFGGAFAVNYPQISDAMLQKKIASLKRSGADTLVSCDAGCLLHIAGRLRRLGEDVRVMHLAELLTSKDETDGETHASGH
jgi:L-lactate dehydrogenase complex protein LldE